MRVTVLGAGSWGTTVASLASKKADVSLWALEPEIAEHINRHHENPTFLPGVALPHVPRLHQPRHRRL